MKLLRPVVVLFVVLFGVLVIASTGPGQRLMRQSAALRGVMIDVASLDLAIFKWRSKRMIANYVQERAVRRLQIGAGTNVRPGWLNTDIEQRDGIAYLDATEPFPLENGTFHYVYSEHVIEHLPYQGDSTC